MRTRMSLSEAISQFTPAIRSMIRPQASFHQARHRHPATTAKSSKRLGEFLDHRLQLGGGIVTEVAAVANGVEDLDMLAAQRRQQTVLERPHLVERKRVEIAVGAGPDHADLLFHLQRRELRLLQQLGQARSTIQQPLGRGVEVASELRERRHLAILREFALDLAGDLLHRFGLRRRSDARHRKADVQRRANALEEQVALEVDLAVGNRDHVGRDVGRHVVGLGFDHRQRGQRARALTVVELGGAFEQTRMQIKHVAGIGFAARRAAQQQRHLAIGDGLFRQIVIDDDRVHAVVAAIFAHGAAGEGGDVLHRRRIGGGGRDDDGIFKRALLFQHLDELRHRGALLADRDIDAIQLDLLVAGGVQRLLVQDGVERDRGLAGLAVADDQLTLAAADRDQGIDGLEASRHRLVDRFARNDAGRLDVDALAFGGLDWALAVDRIAERIDHAAEQAFADGSIDDGAGALDGLAFLDLPVSAEDHDTDIVGLEVERHAAGAVLELDHLAGLDVVEAVDAGDAVADGQHLSDFGNLSLLAEILDLVFQDRGNFRGADVHQPASFIACLIELSLVRSELSTMRLPSLTTRPPMIEGSTFTLRVTSLPVTDFSDDLRASRFLSESASATVTSAVTWPLNLATRARNARMTSRTANRRRLAISTFRKFAEIPAIPALSSTAPSAFDCASALSPSMASNRSRSAFTASMDFSSRANSNRAVA